MTCEDNLNWTPPYRLKKFEKYLHKYLFTKNNKLKKSLKKLAEKSGIPADPDGFIKSQTDKFKNAHRIDAYMKFRARAEFPDDPEDERYQLKPEFFMDNFYRGIFKFFGIECCECCGRIIEDTQNPSAYSRFCKYETEIKSKEPTIH